MKQLIIYILVPYRTDMIIRHNIGLSINTLLAPIPLYLIYRICELEGWNILTVLFKWIFYFSLGYACLQFFLFVLLVALMSLGVFTMKHFQKSMRKQIRLGNAVIDISSPGDKKE